MEKKLSLLDRRDPPFSGPGSEHRIAEHRADEQEREMLLLRESLRTLALENEALQIQVRDLRAKHQQMLDRWEQQAPQLQRVSAGHGQLQASLSHIHQRMTQAEQRLSGLYDSRIWRTLVMAGGAIDRLRGKRHKSRQQLPARDVGAIQARVQRDETSGFPHCLDEPIEGQVLYFDEMIVRGWALFPQETGKIEAAIDDRHWFGVAQGFARPDVASQHPKHPGGERSGFVMRHELQSLTPGPHTLRLRLIAENGETEEIRRSIRIAGASERPARCEGGSSAPGDAVRLRIETPRERDLLFRGSAISLAGWAVAQSQVARVLVSLDGGVPVEVTYGRMREDIGSHYAGFPGAAHGGFHWHASTMDLTPGSHSLLVQAVSAKGSTAEAYVEFQVDRHTAYEVWADRTTATPEELAEMRRQSLYWNDAPRISIITPVYRTPETFLKQCVESVKRQAYPNWELILVDDGSRQLGLTALLEYYAGSDPRIRLRQMPGNGGISMATNGGLAVATGEFIGFLDHDDELSADALYHVARALREDRGLDVLYSDEDKIDAAGRRQEGFFKPEWSPDLLGSMNYVCHFLVARRSLLERVSGMRPEFDGSQDYDLILRLSEQTDRIRRIPRVLYHWRKHSQSTAMEKAQKPAASDAGRRALAEHLQRRGISGRVQETSVCRYRIHYDLAELGEIAIIIPTGGSEKFVHAIDSLLSTTTYRNFQVVVVDNSQGEEVIERVNRFRDTTVKITLLDHRNAPFNFSKLCNAGVAATNSPYLIFLNDDTSVITPDWIETMLEHGQQPKVGAVGPMLLFPDDSIQHAGVIMGTYGTAGHAFRAMPESGGPYYYGFSHVVRNCSAVTGACMLVRREVFERFGGFDEVSLPTCFQDTDFCLKLAESGLRIVYTPFARLYHYESASKRVITGHRELAHMQKRWSLWIQNDPFYNPNLSRSSDCFELDLG
ncbi:MAG TPA: glycosyltransferase [Bryobacteraceae bacterium]|nr:glycosyltransferase [Bryobacteraceae bacterium]